MQNNVEKRLERKEEKHKKDLEDKNLVTDELTTEYVNLKNLGKL